MTIRVGILDDHRSFGEAMCVALSSTPDFVCVGVTTNYDNCQDMLSKLHPDVLLIDYQLIDTTGFECARRLRDAGHTVRIVMLTAHAFSGELTGVALEHGIEQILSKDSPLTEILRSIENGPDVDGGKSGVAQGPRFSRRQREVLGLMGEGQSPGEISESLGLSIHTARRHVKDVMALLEAPTQLAAVTVAIRDGHLIPNRSQPERREDGSK